MPRLLALITIILAGCASPSATTAPATPTPPPSPTSAVPTAAPTTPAGGIDDYEELLGHIPATIRPTCTEVDPEAAAALAVARCQPAELVGTAGDVTYLRYATDDPLFDLLDEKLEEVGDIPTSDDPQSCADGPILTAYHAGGSVEGRLICAPDTRYGGEVIAWWFDYRLNAVGSILLFEGSYEDLYAAVLAAELEP